MSSWFAAMKMCCSKRCYFNQTSKCCYVETKA